MKTKTTPSTWTQTDEARFLRNIGTHGQHDGKRYATVVRVPRELRRALLRGYLAGTQTAYCHGIDRAKARAVAEKCLQKLEG